MSEHAGDHRISGVEVFCAGTHRGKPYSAEDLAQIVRNFHRYSSPKAQKVYLHVPAVIGHEEDQGYLERTDLPAAGWVTDLWRDGTSLFADFDHVPQSVARLIEGKTYRMVSAEIYDEPPDGVPAEPGSKMLRRVAFLGADIPEVKGLSEIPTPEPASYSEGAHLVFSREESFAGGVACFSEVRRPARKYASERPGPGSHVPRSRSRGESVAGEAPEVRAHARTLDHRDANGRRYRADGSVVLPHQDPMNHAPGGHDYGPDEYAEEDEGPEHEPGDEVRYTSRMQDKGKPPMQRSAFGRGRGQPVLVSDDQSNVPEGRTRIDFPGGVVGGEGDDEIIYNRNLQGGGEYPDAEYAEEENAQDNRGVETPRQAGRRVKNQIRRAQREAIAGEAREKRARQGGATTDERGGQVAPAPLSERARKHAEREGGPYRTDRGISDGDSATNRRRRETGRMTPDEYEKESADQQADISAHQDAQLARWRREDLVKRASKYAELPEEVRGPQMNQQQGDGPDKAAMKRDMTRALAQLGVDPGLLEGADERLLAEMLRLLDGKAEQQQEQEQQEQEQEQQEQEQEQQEQEQGEQQMPPSGGAPPGMGMPTGAGQTPEEEEQFAEEDDEEYENPEDGPPVEPHRVGHNHLGRPVDMRFPTRPRGGRGKNQKEMAGDWFGGRAESGVPDPVWDNPENWGGFAEDDEEGEGDALVAALPPLSRAQERQAKAQRQQLRTRAANQGIDPDEPDDFVFSEEEEDDDEDFDADAYRRGRHSQRPGPGHERDRGVPLHGSTDSFGQYDANGKIPFAEDDDEDMEAGDPEWIGQDTPGSTGNRTHEVRQWIDHGGRHPDITGGVPRTGQHAEDTDMTRSADRRGTSQAAHDRRRKVRSDQSDELELPGEDERGYACDMDDCDDEEWAWQQGGEPEDDEDEEFAEEGEQAWDDERGEEDDDWEERDEDEDEDEDAQDMDENGKDDRTRAMKRDDAARQRVARGQQRRKPPMKSGPWQGPASKPPAKNAEEEGPEHEPGETVRISGRMQNKGKEPRQRPIDAGGRGERRRVHEDQSGAEEGHTRLDSGDWVPNRYLQGDATPEAPDYAEEDEPRRGGKGKGKGAAWRRWDRETREAQEYGEQEGTVLRETLDGTRSKKGKKAVGLYTGGVMKLSEVMDFVDRRVAQFVREAVRREAGGAAAGLRKYSEQISRAEKKRGVEAALERLSREGKLAPIEVASVRDRLMRADASQPIRKFSERGREVLLTEFDLQIRELDRRPSMFSELMKQPGGRGGAGGGADAEKEKVEAHYEQFSERFKRLGTSKEDMLSAFENRRKHVADLTAEQFLNVRGG